MHGKRIPLYQCQRDYGTGVAPLPSGVTWLLEGNILQYTFTSFYNYTLDPLPGEKNILYCNEDQIYIIPVSGGKQTPIMKRTTTNSGPTVPNSAVWSPDGNYIFYPQNIDGGSVLWQITLDGKNPKEVYNSKVPICSLSIHPNGQKIVMTTLDQGAEIWKVDKLLSNDETVDK